MGYFPRFFFNATSEQCEEFIYGGCGGNENNFEKEGDCKASCKPGKENRALLFIKLLKEGNFGSYDQLFIVRYFYQLSLI